MALQGTLDTFALPDVLRLLAGTAKTGGLEVWGARGIGAIHLDGGSVVSASLDGDTSVDPVEATFRLLRMEEGSFEFQAGATPARAGAPMAVEELLTAAEALMQEWIEIERVVSSTSLWVSLVPTIDKPVSIIPDHWRALATLGSGATVSELGNRMHLGEVAVCRLTRDLVQAGTVTLSEIMIPVAAPAPAPVVVEEPPTPEVAQPEPADGPIVSLDDDVPSWATSSVEFERDPEPYTEEYAEAPAAERDAIYERDSSYERELAVLSPRAAAAVQAVDGISDSDRRAAAEEVLEDDADSINRNLLLKFLSSVKD